MNGSIAAVHGRQPAPGRRMSASASPAVFGERAALFHTLASGQPQQELPVTGRLPDWLCGVLLRNGPAQFEAGTRSLRHWFDGAAMLHRFAFADGAVRYTSRFLRSKAQAAMGDPAAALREFATDPCTGLFGRVMAIVTPNTTDNANINVARLGGKTVALSESTPPLVVDPETLETRDPWPIDGRGTFRFILTSAHPQPNGAGGWLNYWTRLGARPRYEVFSLDSLTHRRTVLGSIPARRPAYMHSFAATPRTVVLSEFPLTVAPIRLLLGRRSFIETFAWQPERGTRFRLVPRDGSGKVATCEAPAMFAFHHVGAWDDGDGLVLDLVAYDEPGIIDQLYLDELRGPRAYDLPRSTVRRIRLNGRTGRAETLADFPVVLELPTTAPGSGRHRIIYGVGAPDPAQADFPHAVGRLDTETGDASWWSPPGCYASEPVFVPRPGARREDDGVLLSVVLDTAARRSFLIVLDAASLGEIARANAPVAIPAGLHGSFEPGALAPQ